MPSFVECCNLSLSKLGETTRIVNIDTDNTKAANLFRSNYLQILRETLRKHPWNFAKKRVVLAPSTDGPAWGGGNYFDLPGDWLRTFKVNDDYPTHESEGKKILWDGTELNLIYIRNITDPNMFDELFTAAYSTRMAWVNAFGMTKSLEMQDAMKRMYTEDIADAKRNNAIDRGLQRMIADDFTTRHRSG